MTKAISLLFSTILLTLALAACSNSDEPAKHPDPVSRTVLVYMVANNNLHDNRYPSRDYDHLDLAEMADAARNGGLNGGRLLVYHVSADDAPRLLEIMPDGSQTVLRAYPEGTVSVAAKQMRGVLDDVRSLAPAADYGIVFWSHGSGWLEDGIEQSQNLRSFGLDGSSAKMNVSVLADVLAGYDHSFIYFDCCLMAGVEVFYELRECAPYIVASASELPVFGMDYTSNIPCFFASGQPDLRRAALNTYKWYDARTDEYRTCTISLIETARLDAVAAAARDIYASMSLPYNLHSYPQTYLRGSSFYYDLADYAGKIMDLDSEKVKKLTEAIDAAVVCRYNTPYLWPGTQFDAVRLDSHCGMSTFMVRSGQDIFKRNYNHLKWYKDVVSAMTEK